MNLRLFVALGCSLLASIAGCKDQKNPDGPDRGAVDKEQLCADGGAAYDIDNNECTCPAGSKWNGNRCEAVEDVRVRSCRESGGSWDKDESRCDCREDMILRDHRCSPKGGEASRGCRESGGDWREAERTCDCPSGREWREDRCRQGGQSGSVVYNLSRVKEACKSAGGQWQADDELCKCPEQKFLKGQDCVAGSGKVTKSLCTGTTYPGTWRDERCYCDDTTVFSPPRGGCAPKYTGSDLGWEYLCENSLNNGEWAKDSKRCECRRGQIWHEEICLVQEDLSSREVCESDFNRGTWDKEHKRCKCRVGFMWIDQTCKSLKFVGDKDACESEFNKGRWDSRRNTCLCPGVSGWLASIKLCVEGGASTAQQLCLQSGGTPGQDQGACTCGTGLKVQTLQPQGIQYCAKDGSDVPEWLLILLGLLQ